MSAIRHVASGRAATRGNKAVWTVQIVLALLFLFAGGMKLAMPAATLSQLTGLPGAFMKFIGIAEFSGALGLVLPGLTGIKRFLTPIAAVGLVTIMAGATTLMVTTGQVAGAALPLAVGVLAATVARKRWSWTAHDTGDAGSVIAALDAPPAAA
jgi:hypothetical protein